MSTLPQSPLTAGLGPAAARLPGLPDRMLARAVSERLALIEHGILELVDRTGSPGLDGAVFRFGHSDVHPSTGEPLFARVEILDSEFWWAIAMRGSVGAGEAWARGNWTSADPVAVVRLFGLNRALSTGLEGGLARLSRPWLSLFHRLRPNTPAGARRNIAAHYDLGNEFFERVLDPTLSYSCAVFEHEGQSLEDASLNKLERTCRKLGLTERDHLLEIGTGWGGLALYAAQHLGCRVTTTTISRAQHKVATERIRAAGLADRVTVLCEDYRELRGEYDKVVSIEMIEAIGWKQYESYFASISRLLCPNGRALVQAITIQDQYYEDTRRSVDFVQRYVFPGCTIPSTTALLGAMTSASDLRLVHLEDITPHYATTLRHWREALYANSKEIQALGYTEEFLRLFEWYLVYCEGAFQERAIQDVQYVFCRPLDRGAPILGTLG